MPNPNSARLAAKQRSVIEFLVDRFPQFPEDVKARFPSISQYESETERWRQRLQLKLAELGPDEVEDIVAEGEDFLQRSGGTMLGFLTLFADPQNPLHAATKTYVDKSIELLKELIVDPPADSPIDAGSEKVFIFLSPKNSWPLPHLQGKYPKSIRTLVKLPTSTTLHEIAATRTDSDEDNSQIDFGANYEGRAILAF